MDRTKPVLDSVKSVLDSVKSVLHSVKYMLDRWSLWCIGETYDGQVSPYL